MQSTYLRPWCFNVSFQAVVLCVIALGLAGVPQVGPGDLVVTCTTPGAGVYGVDRNGRATTVYSGPIDFPNAVTMAPDNFDLCVAFADAASNFTRNPVLRMATDGRIVATIAHIDAGIPNALDLDQTGRLFAFVSKQNAVLSLDPDGGAISTTAHRLPTGVLNAGATDPRTGGTVLGAYWSVPGGGLLRSEPGGRTTTLALGLGRVTGVAADPVHGGYVVTRRDAPEILRVFADGRVATLANVFDASAVAVASDGTMWVTGANRLVRLSGTGRLLASLALPGHATGLTLYGGRTLVTRGAADAGSTVDLEIFSQRALDGGQPYVLAASTGFSPALGLPDGRRLALAPSGLFAASLLGWIPHLRGFQGTLDGLGKATAHLDVPTGIGRTDIALGGVVIDTRAGKISTLLGPVGLTLAP